MFVPGKGQFLFQIKILLKKKKKGKGKNNGMFRLVGKEAKFCASFSNKLHICFLEYDKELQKYETFRNRRFLKNTLYFLTFLRPTDALLHERENKLLRFWKF